MARTSTREHRRTRRGRAAFAAGVLGLGLGLAPLGAADGAQIYVFVRKTGCSDAGHGSSTLPYCTIVKAATAATAGQIVVVYAGTYTGEVFPWHSGTSTARITFRPVTGNAVVITGARHGFTISNHSWITVTGFKIQNTTSNGIYVYNATGLNLTANTVQTSGRRVSGAAAYGMYLNAMKSSVVKSNKVLNNSASGVFVTNGSTGNQFVGNEIAYNAYGYVRNAVGMDLRAPGNLISGNRVHHNEDSGIQLFPGGDRNRIVNNVVYANKGFTTAAQTNCTHPPTGNTAGCITGDHGIDSSGTTGGWIIGNTVYGNATAGINLEGLAAGTNSGYRIVNNIAVDNAVNCPDGAGGVVKCPRNAGNVRVDKNSVLGTVLDYDLVSLSTAGTMMVWGSTSYSSLAAMKTASGQDAHGHQANPRFVNAAGGVFTLQAGSPAIDSANSSAPGQSTTDAASHRRVDDPATANTGAGVRLYDDRGAYEFQP
ncbi:right-handed parallel beta-helix repeat-containing protein [Intrasporangium sp. YIM S08009]|uniref:right-handed parallel beta-helix repeat-containing protein n=1 Tax=Intrasporangium zincisolvens TaxID=3080018 RepID=UPI002B056CB1|nr:right-handed parallel beta-helix repeat-containing protein [Intrasporangium sp. YIM S08009]